MSIAKILVIEDETSIRGLIEDILNLENYDVIEAENGEQGLTTALFILPDLILCDVMMSGIDGYEVLRQLQQNSSTRTIPFIFLSAKATPQDTRQGMNLGADDYITKPFQEDDLLEAIEIRLKKSAIHKNNNGLREKKTNISLSYHTRFPHPIDLTGGQGS